MFITQILSKHNSFSAEETATHLTNCLQECVHQLEPYDVRFEYSCQTSIMPRCVFMSNTR